VAIIFPKCWESSFKAWFEQAFNNSNGLSRRWSSVFFFFLGGCGGRDSLTFFRRAYFFYSWLVRISTFWGLSFIMYLEIHKIFNKIINILGWQQIFSTTFWISKKSTLIKVPFHFTELMFSDTKNRTGMAGSNKAVSNIVEFPTLNGGYWWQRAQPSSPRNS
jgi:hypothetical protein